MPLQLEKPDSMPISNLTIKAYKNYFETSMVESSYGRIQAPTSRVNISNLAALIADRNSGVEPALISFVARLLHEETMRQLNDGKSVEVLGLGTVYVTTKGKMRGLNPGLSDVPHMVLKFKPSKAVKTKIKKIGSAMVVPITIKPIINLVQDLKTKDTSGRIKKGSVIKITGKRLRVEGSHASVGLYFIREDGGRIDIDPSLIIRNEPSTLEVLLPETLSEGVYTLEIRNQGRFKDAFTKALRIGQSDFTVTIIS